MHPSRRKVLAGGLGALAATTTATSAGASAPAVPTTSTLPATSTRESARVPHEAALAFPTLVSATPNTELNARFTAYANSGDGITGMDGTYSANLGNGRQLWAFSDSFLGTVNPDGSRPANSPFIRNCAMVQQGTAFTSVYSGTKQNPRTWLEPPTAGNWLWVGGNLVTGTTLQAIYSEYRPTGSGVFDFEWVGDQLVTIRTTDLAVLGMRRLPVTGTPSTAKISWSVWVQPAGSYTYIYGVEDLQQQKFLHVSRVAGTDLGGRRTYFNGSGWSRNESASARVLEGIGNSCSLTTYGQYWMLITQDTTEIFSRKIVAYFGTSPRGPFAGKTLLYQTPEAGGNVITYGFHEHPELRVGNKLLVSYDVNSVVAADVYADVSIYRPRFVDIVLDPDG